MSDNIKFEETLKKMIKDMPQEDVLDAIRSKKIEKIKKEYRCAEKKPICIKINKVVYEKTCKFCNAEGEFDSIEAKSSLSGMIETTLKLFLSREDLFDDYFELYTSNQPARGERREVGKDRKENKED